MRLLALALVALAGCRFPPDLAKQPAFDFDAAVAPAPADFSTEATLLARWNAPPGDTLRAFWDSGTEGRFTGVEGAELVYRVHRAPAPKAAVVLLPGRTEAIIKYAEVAEDLVRHGYSTYALTLRGQGEASRLLPDGDKGYVAYFDDYVADTHRFLTDVVKPDGLPVFFLAHSTGGAVAALVVDAYPDDVQAFATTAPMFEINLGAFPPPVAATLGEGVCSATDGSGYSVGAGPYREETDFPGNTVTQSEARWTWKVQQLRDDASLRLGGVTWRWVCQSLAGSSRATQSGRFNATPTLVLMAGLDTIVKPGGQERYCADAPRCTLSRFPDAKHELLQEADVHRNLALSQVVKFFDAQVRP